MNNRRDELLRFTNLVAAAVTAMEVLTKSPSRARAHSSDLIINWNGNIFKATFSGPLY